MASLAPCEQENGHPNSKKKLLHLVKQEIFTSESIREFSILFLVCLVLNALLQSGGVAANRSLGEKDHRGQLSMSILFLLLMLKMNNIGCITR